MSKWSNEQLELVASMSRSDMTYREMAKAMGVTVGVVAGLVRTAKERDFLPSSFDRRSTSDFGTQD